MSIKEFKLYRQHPQIPFVMQDLRKSIMAENIEEACEIAKKYDFEIKSISKETNTIIIA